MNVIYKINKVKTNIKPELVEDFITDGVLRGQMGKGEDKSKAAKRDTFHIHISCDMSYDQISISSDTGNKGLTAGIIAHAVGKGVLTPSALEKAAS